MQVFLGRDAGNSKRLMIITSIRGVLFRKRAIASIEMGNWVNTHQKTFNFWEHAHNNRHCSGCFFSAVGAEKQQLPKNLSVVEHSPIF
ncbi:TPA: hypothetical protein DDW35_06975 [Candidatus Sumerlaeota bacterium]|nr:hypothetical protein [Candidatus Sumerlaeota bacterium]